MLTVLAMTASEAAAGPTLLVLPLGLTDTSGEMPPHTQEHKDRLAALTRYLSQMLAADGLYTVIDPTPIAAAIDKASASQPLDACNGCERDLARQVRAERVLIGRVDKVSTLIGSLRLNIEDVATGRSVFSRVLSFRGDTDDAWQHAVRFFVRDLQAAPLQAR
jgi:Protein of unknown function (DUF2380)